MSPVLELERPSLVQLVLDDVTDHGLDLRPGHVDHAEDGEVGAAVLKWTSCKDIYSLSKFGD